jgi:hypothetical protein
LRRLAAVLLLAGPVGAQSAPGPIVDQGSFTITIGGAAAGRETFAIRRLAAGYQASGTVLLADRRLVPLVVTDLAGTPVSYTLDVRDAPGHIERVSVTRDRGFLTLRAHLADRESLRELPVTIGGTVLLDDDIAHQYYFLMLGRREGVVSVLVPQRRAVLSMRVDTAGVDSVHIGGHALAAERVRLASEAGDERLVWIDAAGRVLQLSIPERRLMALRDSPP